jgi:glycosyltransferase involved in cell wall biosynthesis
LPEFSVVIPSYNHAPFIGEAVESVLKQTMLDLELIVVDDGSTDNSLEVLSCFSDNRMRVLAQANQGAHAAINRGIREASGKYLAILNSDDAYHPQRLNKAAVILNSNPQVSLVGSYIEIIDSEGRPLGVKHGFNDCPPWLLEAPERSFRAGTDLKEALLTENYWSTTSNFVYRREAYLQVGEYRPLRYAHDWDYVLRLARIAKLFMLPEPLIRYRIHPSNTIRENQAAMVFEICWILAVHLPGYLTDQSFYSEFELHQRLDQLLHSIYVYDMDRVLSVMLLQSLHENPDEALHLLEPANPARRTYLEYIERKLASLKIEYSAGQPQTKPAPALSPSILRKTIQSLMSRVK